MTYRSVRGASCFFFNDTATTEIYTLSLHDALPIYALPRSGHLGGQRAAIQAAKLGRRVGVVERRERVGGVSIDRKSTRLNSSHANISYAVFCLKKTKTVV